MARLHASGRLDKSFGKRGWFFDAQERAELFCMAQKSNGDFEVGGAVLPMRRYTAILATIGPNGTGSITIPNVDPFPPPENPVYGIAVLSDTQRVWAGKSDVIEGDPSGNRGFQPTNLGAEAGVSDIVVQPDGKAVMLMYGSASFSLTRVNPDGSLDGTFGNRGMSKASLADTGELDRQVKYAQELILLPDGRILAAGTVNSVSHSPSHGMVVARFGADGRLDSTFGKGGFSIVNSVSDDFYLTHTRVAVDGKIVIAGGEIMAFPGIARLGAYGLLDASFAGDGFISDYEFTDVLCEVDLALGEYLSDVAVSADGSMVLSGWLRNDTGMYSMRLSNAGTLDPSFADHGVRLALEDPLGKMQRDGTFLDNRSKTSIDLVHHHADGSPDPAFGVGGHAKLDLPGTVTIREIQTQGDAKIIVAGMVKDSAGAQSVFVARFNSNGAIDTSFGGADGWDSAAVGAKDVISRVQLSANAATFVVQRVSDSPVQSFVALRFGL
jgi:uncharacterized delta-60 repeat protein